LLEYYDGTQWKSIDSPPVVSSVSPTEISSDAGGNATIVVTGSSFSATITEVRFIGANGTDIVAGTVVRDSATQITVTEANSSFLTAQQPYGVKVTNSSGLSNTLANQINVDTSPSWQTASGSLGAVYDSGRTGVSFTALATDAESDAITYSLQSGSLPSGLSLTSTSSGAVISGNANAVGSNTTSTFTIRATANSKTADRQFTITVYAPQISSFTSSGTFSVPSGLTSVNVLVVGGGGAAGKSPGNGGGGGGAGGLIYRPAFPVTPGGTVTVTVGDGGARHSGFPSTDPSKNGQNSVFGTLTAQGGGSGGAHGSGGVSGGSGGGAGRDSGGAAAGSGNQPSQPGDSGTYGFGNPGGIDGSNPGSSTGGGGGGAGGAGNAGYAPDQSSTPGTASKGGDGRIYSISGSPVGYAGGGSGSSGHPTTDIDGSPTYGSGGYDNVSNGVNGEGNGQDATANRGSGGGAGRGPTSYDAGAGGKGIVIVSY
jgi:hypothetical protein